MDNNFEFNGALIRTVLDDQEQVWFAGVDVCNILGYAKASTTIEKLDEDEKKLEYLTDTSGQRRKAWSINEFGLYSLILSSSKSEAKAFKRWVTHDVLPAIRKAGKYTSQEEQEREEAIQSYVAKIETLEEKKSDYQQKVRDTSKDIEVANAELRSWLKSDFRQRKLKFEN
jgi:anti-repressor protein